ncbi:hypothetical protein DRH27_05820 [Candidatus Falkowbacteria bacterium]|nr:MAG: hypothetical protein DRH27_05820 [Candidatus Falkowbacteria bacterium]
MSYLLKRTDLEDRTILELKTKNFYIFVACVFLSVIPAAFIVSHYFPYNVNFFRVPYILLILIVYAILGGRGSQKIFRINKTRKGSLFSFKNPVKYSVPNKK